MASAARTRTSLRLRILLATLALVAIALGVAAFAFERVAKAVILEAVHSHLGARANEVQEAVERFQRERTLTVRNWSEAEAMQLTLDSGDPKFAEDYLKRTIQDQGGAITAAALLTIDGEIVVLVRPGAEGERRGVGIPEAAGETVDATAIPLAPEGHTVGTSLASLSALVPGSTEGDVILLAAPVVDFASDLVAFVAAAISPTALSRLLDEVNGEASHYVPVVSDREGRLVLSIPGADEGWVRRARTAAPIGALGSLERIERGNADALLAVRTHAQEAIPGWSTLMLVDEAEVEGRLLRLRLLLAILYGAVLAGGAVAAVLSVRQAAKPLTQVAASMSRVAGGDLTTRVPAEYKGELGHLAHSFNTMVEEVERSRDELQRTEALRREVQIAHQIQTAILPVSPAVKGYEVAARMKPADDVGGDLYDILAFDKTFWVLIGDVSGHGINSGLIMMMSQAAAYGAIADDPLCSPRDVIATVNRVVHENVQRRMRRDDYLTLMAVRHLGDGRFLAAGAHQPVFVVRAGGTVDVVEASGQWVGLAPDFASGIREHEFRVGPGELVCFITDGVVEAANGSGQLFGEDRLAAILRQANGASASHVLGEIFSQVEAHSDVQADDMTAVVLRRKNED
jgi:sigma-B regulation protein RsbU (phosphoserine phosphatase)